MIRSTRRAARAARGRGALALLALLALAGGASAETLYVRSASTEMRDAPSASAGVVADLERGDALDVLARDGSWVQVSASGASGWVHKLKLSTEEPSDGGSVLAGLGGGRGDYVKEAEAGRGARGLEESAERYARDEQLGEQAIQTVKRMEQVRVTESDIDAFLREGQLGEWSE